MSDLKESIATQIASAGSSQVWVPTDFARLGNRDAVDKVLQRMVLTGDLRRIDRGLYDKPTVNRLTQQPTTPDYRAIVGAIARRDQLRVLVDGMTAANDLGLTDAVPAHVTIHTDARRRAIRLDRLTIDFKNTAPSRLYWAGRPAMCVVQALHWLKDSLTSDQDRILNRLKQVLADPQHGEAIRQDLIDGISAMPARMQILVRKLTALNAHPATQGAPPRRKSTTPRSDRTKPTRPPRGKA